MVKTRNGIGELGATQHKVFETARFLGIIVT